MRQGGDLYPRQHLLQGSPASTAVVEESIERAQIVADLAALTTQVALGVAVPCQVGDVINSITFLSGATAADTPLNWWFALYDTAGALMAQSADQTTGAWAANTPKKLALASTVTITKAGIYVAALMMKATAPVSLGGVLLENAVAAGALVVGMPVLAKTFGAALTATAPATIATPTTVATVPYAALT